MASERIDLRNPVWDLKTFSDRINYYSWVTDPRLSIIPTKTLKDAKDLVDKYRKGEEPAGTTVTQIRRAQQMYLSAFHPDSGELQNFIGRMSFQVPGGMILIGAMVTFYRSNSAVIFWQWANQSFNALVNYTNRNAASDISTKKIAVAYVTATSCALVTALGLKALLAKRASPLLQRLVPYAAVCAANAVNIPLMRQSELMDGVTVFDENNKEVTKSRYAAVKGIGQVLLSRIVICTPGMTVQPIIMERFEKTAFLMKYRFLTPPLQILFSGFLLIFMVPLGCSIFPQKCSIDFEKLKSLDKENMKDVLTRLGSDAPKKLYFNKGL